MFVTAAPCRSPICVMWYSDGPGNELNCHPKSEPQNSRLFSVSSAGISMCTISPAISLSSRVRHGESAPAVHQVDLAPDRKSSALSHLERSSERLAVGRPARKFLVAGARLEIEEADLPVDGGATLRFGIPPQPAICDRAAVSLRYEHILLSSRNARGGRRERSEIAVNRSNPRSVG